MTVHVALQKESLDILEIIALVRSPKAGAIVTFTGTTRDSFNGQEVLHLDYEAHEALALKSMHAICTSAKEEYGLIAVACYHRLGRVPIAEESIFIAVSCAHRTQAWRAGEYILEEVKKRTEIWKLETFKDEENVKSQWKANYPQ